MSPTDTREAALEALIVGQMVAPLPALRPGTGIADDRGTYLAAGWVQGNAEDYDRTHALDTAQLLAFLQATQPHVVETLQLASEGPARQRFLDRLQGEITKRGTIDVLRKGVKQGPASVALFFGAPSPGNEAARERHLANR